MKKTLVLLSVGLLFIGSSCKKEFNHTSPIEMNADNSCQICGYADSIQGIYRGLNSYHPWEPNDDTVNFKLEHFYMGLGNSKDSTLMFFHLMKDMGLPSAEALTVSMDNASGIFYQTPLGDFLIIDGDSLHYRNVFFNGQDTVLIYQFDGKKIP